MHISIIPSCGDGESRKISRKVKNFLPCGVFVVKFKNTWHCSWIRSESKKKKKKKKSDTCWNKLLIENPQFLPNFYETWSKWPPRELSILTKCHKNWAKIVDFLLKAYFSMCTISFDSDLITLIFNNMKNIFVRIYLYYNILFISSSNHMYEWFFPRDILSLEMGEFTTGSPTSNCTF